MMGGGEFIVNGSERVIVAQLHRSPGIDFSVEHHTGDKKDHSARVSPERGSWIEMGVSKKGHLQVRIDQQGKFSALTLLRAMNADWGTDDAVLRLFYPVEKIKRGKSTKPKFAAAIENRRALGGVRDMKTGEVWVEAGQEIVPEAAERIAASDIAEVEVISEVEDSLILDSLKEDTASSHEEALAAIFAKLRPSSPIQLEKARELLHDRVFDPQRYSLGRVGRFRR